MRSAFVPRRCRWSPAELEILREERRRAEVRTAAARKLNSSRHTADEQRAAIENARRVLGI